MKFGVCYFRAYNLLLLTHYEDRTILEHNADGSKTAGRKAGRGFILGLVC